MQAAFSLFRLDSFVKVSFYIGIARITSYTQFWYKTTFQWSDKTVVHDGQLIPGKLKRPETYILGRQQPSHCAVYNPFFHLLTFPTCNVELVAAALCEKDPLHTPRGNETAEAFLLPALGNDTYGVTVVTCPEGHVTHEFLACDVPSKCWSRDKEAACAAPLTPLPPSYTCRDLGDRVPYTLVCDHRADCMDGSDEDFCKFPLCPPGTYSCGDAQCIPRNKVCNGHVDCFSVSKADEMGCWDSTNPTFWFDHEYDPPPGVLNVLFNGTFTLRKMPRGKDGVEHCPDSHILCPGQGICVPLYMRCNGVFDCVGHEDEAACDHVTCTGFYRCRHSAVCVAHAHVCDGVPQCPQHDDELLCELQCPPSCVCRGMAFFCERSFPVGQFQALRYLDAAGSGLTPTDFYDLPLLVFLSLAQCGLTSLRGLAFVNLLYLDVSHNNLTSLLASAFDGVPQLLKVVLAGNGLLQVLNSGEGRHERIAELDLSGVHVPELNASLLTAYTALQHLNLSGSGLQRVVKGGFQPLTGLRVVDLRGCPMTHVPPVMFQGLRSLQAVYADSFRLCCPALLPADFNLHKCQAPFDEVSSCDNLLGSETYSAVTFVVAVIAVFGNGSSFIFRVFVGKKSNKQGFRVFVSHLSLSDFFMGLYLLVLGAADRVYMGRYLWNDLSWRNSAACKVAGFLSLLSSEVSALIVCLITLDRFLVLRFPFSTLHFGFRSAHLASCPAWLAGLFLAAVPLLPLTSHWRFYGHSSICLPLPVTRKDFAGRGYSFSIVIVLNFVLFLFVFCGQLVIYWSVQANAMAAAATSSSTKKSKDLTIARRLLAVAMSDFLAWFPIGLLGLLASRGVPIPGEVNVAMAVLVLPLNSALNPFLYTVNVLLERRRLAREERLRKLLLSHLNAKS